MFLGLLRTFRVKVAVGACRAKYGIEVALHKFEFQKVEIGQVDINGDKDKITSSPVFSKTYILLLLFGQNLEQTRSKNI